MSDSNNDTWRKKALGVLQACETELRRTTAIGVKMLHASRASTELHETYEELGKMAIKAMEEGELDWPSLRVKSLVNRARELEAELSDMEVQVRDLKKDESNS
jgi:hypothetical protein